MNGDRGLPGLRATRDHIPELDGLRGIAVLLVLWAHIQSSWLIPLTPMAGLVGWFAVDLFFALSGFLITRILIYNRAHGVPLQQFLLRRAGRIFPAFYLALVVLMVAGIRADMGATALYFYNYLPAEGWRDVLPLAHFWSLCVEEHFYLVWPVVVIIVSPTLAKRLAILGILTGIAAAFLWNFALSDGYEASAMIYRSSHIRMVTLLAGACVAFVEADHGLRPHVMMMMAVGVLLFARLLFTWASGRIDDETSMIAMRLVMVSSASTAVLCFTLSRVWEPWNMALRGPRLCYIGRISYGLYLYHLPIYYWLGAWRGDAGTLNTLLAVVITGAVAVASYHWFETPIRKAVNRWTDGKRIAHDKTPASAETLTGAEERMSELATG